MRKRRLWISLAVIAVFVAGGAYLTTRPAAGQANSSSLTAGAETASVVRTTLLTTIDSTGSLMPETEINLSFGASGTVKAVNVAAGDSVKQGDVLATLDTTDLEYKVTQAEQAYQLQQLTYSETVQPADADVKVAQAAYASAAAAYQAAQTDYANLTTKEAVQCASLTSAKANLDRAQAAYDRIANDHQASQYLNGDWGPFQQVVNGLENAQAAYDQAVSNCNITKLNLNDSALRSAEAQLHTARTALDNLTSPRAEKVVQAAAALEQARLSLEQARRNLAGATITAPFDGLVTAVNLTAGSTSGAGSITLVDVSRLHVDVLVDETEIAGVAVGQAAEVTLDAVDGITLTGKVAAIAPAGTVSNGVVNYSVRVNLDASAAALKLDMTANTAIIGEKRENVLAVPTTAIRTMTRQAADSASTASSIVLVVKDGQPRPVPVTVGMTANNYTEVSGDLQEGDLVLITTTTSSSTNSPMQDFGGPPPDGGGGPMGGPPPGG